MCRDRKENVDRRDNSINVRMTLSTLTYACFYKLHIMFFPEGSGSRVFTKEMFSKFNEISLAALIMSSGYILDYGVFIITMYFLHDIMLKLIGGNQD